MHNTSCFLLTGDHERNHHHHHDHHHHPQSTAVAILGFNQQCGRISTVGSMDTLGTPIAGRFAVAGSELGSARSEAAAEWRPVQCVSCLEDIEKREDRHRYLPHL